MTKTELTCGVCRTPLITIVDQNESIDLTVASNTGLHFDIDEKCTALCGACRAATTVRLNKVTAVRLRRHLELSAVAGVSIIR